MKVYLPLNMNDNHWILVAIEKDTESIIIYDSFKETYPELESLLQVIT